MLGYYISGILVLLTVVYQWLTWNYKYWKKRGVPQLEPSLIFGNVKDVILLREQMGAVYDAFYRKMPDEPLVGLYRLRQPQLLVRDAELVKTMLIKEFSSFHDNDFDIDTTTDPVFGLNPFVIKGEKWKAARTITSAALTPNKIKVMVEHMISTCKELVAYLKKNEGDVLEIKEIGGHFTSDVVTGCVYGLSTSTFKDPNSVYRKMIKKTFSPDFLTNVGFLIFSFLPSLGKLLNFRLFPKDVEQFFSKVVHDAVEYRKNNKLRSNDFLQHLLDQKDKQGKPQFNEFEIMAHSMTFIVDGYETSSVLISHIADMLSRHPQVQERLRQELRGAIESVDKLSFDTLHSLSYLDAVVNETLRIRSPATVLLKRCTKDIVLSWQGRNYSIEKDTAVVIPVYSIQKDPQYFPEPEVFRPDRFLEDPNPVGFMPFGLGPRACLGSKFALTQVKACIAAIVMNFEIIPTCPVDAPVEFEKKSTLMLVVKGGVNVKFRSLN